MYGQIISFLFVILIMYYVVMIILDLQKAKAAKAAELEKNPEEEIDISDEAKTFKPVLISREDPNKANTSVDSNGESKQTSESKEDNQGEQPQKNESEKKDDESKNNDTSEAQTVGDKPNLAETDKPTDQPISKENEVKQDLEASSSNDKEPVKPTEPEKPFRRAGYREAAMTGGLDVDTLLLEVDHFAETGKGPLGQVILECQAQIFRSCIFITDQSYSSSTKNTPFL